MNLGFRWTGDGRHRWSAIVTVVLHMRAVIGCHAPLAPWRRAQEIRAAAWLLGRTLIWDNLYPRWLPVRMASPTIITIRSSVAGVPRRAGDWRGPLGVSSSHVISVEHFVP